MRSIFAQKFYPLVSDSGSVILLPLLVGRKNLHYFPNQFRVVLFDNFIISLRIIALGISFSSDQFQQFGQLNPESMNLRKKRFQFYFDSLKQPFSVGIAFDKCFMRIKISFRLSVFTKNFGRCIGYNIFKPANIIPLIRYTLNCRINFMLNHSLIFSDLIITFSNAFIAMLD